ncbi:hypothetical protein EON81_13940 [bacterium]|nr:MAG: hypothetical protein EON81_13940 [bacterium]
MSVKSERKAEKKSIPVWAVPLLVVGGFFVAIYLSDRPTMVNGMLSITSDGQYDTVSRETQALLAEPLLRADSGGELTEEDRDRLNKGIPIFRALCDFRPTEMGPFFVLGKLYENLGMPAEAEEVARQSIINGQNRLADAKIKKDVSKELETLTLLNESRHVRAQALFDLKQYEESIKEMKTVLLFGKPRQEDLPRYLYTTARSLTEYRDPKTGTRDIGAAKAALKDALKIDPNFARAKSLQKFLESSGS